MNKFLFSALLSTLSLSTFAQEQKISFEESEGFILNNLNGQKGWSTVGSIYDNYTYVTSDKATDGVQSVKVDYLSSYSGKWGGIKYNLPNYKNFSISTDVSMDELGNSSYIFLSLLTSQGLDLVNVGSFVFYKDGSVEIKTLNKTFKLSSTWSNNRWYNLKTEVNLSKKEIKFFINNSLVYTNTFSSSIEKIDEVDYHFDNNYSNFSIDNVVIKNLGDLSTDELNKKEIKIYPNPIQDVLSVQTNEKINSVEIFDLTGKSILKSSEKTINTQTLAKGVYIVKVKTDNQEISQKIIKK